MVPRNQQAHKVEVLLGYTELPQWLLTFGPSVTAPSMLGKLILASEVPSTSSFLENLILSLGCSTKHWGADGLC